MMKRTHWAALATLCFAIATGCGTASNETTATEEAALQNDSSSESSNESAADSSHSDFYTVSTYDESLDPADDFAKTIARAKAENKRVILQVGGDWCGWCGLITDYMLTNPAVSSHLGKNFLVMKVTYPGDHAKEFLSKYPKCEAYPHLFVLDQDGELLHSQGTGELEKGKGYDEAVFMAFLKKWTL